MRQDELIEAYVVQARPWRETSMLYKMIARRHGWLSLVHKGVRKNRRERPLPVLTSVRVSWSGRSSLQTLRHAEAHPMPVISAPERQVAALYLNEILSYLLPEDGHSDEIYPFYHAALQQLNETEDWEQVLRGAELDVLQMAGHPLQLEQTEQGRVKASQRYRYVPDTGPVELSSNSTEEGISGETLLKLYRRSGLNANQRREARRLMRRVLDHYVAPRVIHSRNIMRAFKH